MVDQHHGCSSEHEQHNHSLKEEMLHHLPYAIFSLAFGLIILSFIDVLMPKMAHSHHSHSHAHDGHDSGAHLLFHSFHFLHIIFAVTGSLITFSRFSKNIVKGAIVSIVSSLFFCTLSDVVLPYLSGTLLGVHMHFHLCLQSEWHNVVPLLLIGLINGIVMSRHSSSIKAFYSVSSHFGHILISSLASLFYLVSEGLENWYPQMGILFLFLIVAVVVPCTLADVVVPMIFAKSRKKHEKYSAREYQEAVR